MSVLLFVFLAGFALVLLFLVVSAARRGHGVRGKRADGAAGFVASDGGAWYSTPATDCSDGGGGGCDGGGGS